MPEDNKIVHTVTLNGPKPQLLIQEGEFKSKPMLHIVFLGGMGKPLSFGVGKAKMILHSLPEIQAFYDKHQATLKD
jgi:hypothetical protein